MAYGLVYDIVTSIWKSLINVSAPVKTNIAVKVILLRGLVLQCASGTETDQIVDATRGTRVFLFHGMDSPYFQVLCVCHTFVLLLVG